MTRLPNVQPGEVLREEFLVPMRITAYRLANDTGLPQTQRFDWENILASPQNSGSDSRTITTLRMNGRQ